MPPRRLRRRACSCGRCDAPLRSSSYDGVTSGIDRDADMFDWLIFCVLFGVGFIPGIIWWYLAIHRDRFFVALASGHGAPAYYLYRGASQEQVEEMTQTIQDVAFAL